MKQALNSSPTSKVRSNIIPSIPVASYFLFFIEIQTSLSQVRPKFSFIPPLCVKRIQLICDRDIASPSLYLHSETNKLGVSTGSATTKMWNVIGYGL